MSKEQRSEVEIARMATTIGGDARYRDVILVLYVPLTDSVRVTVTESVPAGGMDGDSTSSVLPTSFDSTVGPDPKPAEVVALVKRALGNPSFNFKGYAKPSRDFVWLSSPDRRTGVTQLNALAAVAWARAQK